MRALAWAAALAVALAGLLPGTAFAADSITGVPATVAYGSAGAAGATLTTAGFNATIGSDSQTWNFNVRWSNLSNGAGASIGIAQRRFSGRDFGTDAAGTNNVVGCPLNTWWGGTFISPTADTFITPAVAADAAQAWCSGTNKIAAGTFQHLTTVKYRVLVPANQPGGTYAGTVTWTITH